ncbi:MAG: hypothetical protein WCF96_04250 [Eubacteriales bacterium]
MNRSRTFFSLLLCLCLFLLTSCTGTTSSDSENQTSGNTNEVSNEATAGNHQSVANQTSQQVTTNLTNGSVANTQDSVTVIAKSNNTVSDVEKQTVLNQLGHEMDSLLNTVNDKNLDEVQESDLSF